MENCIQKTVKHTTIEVPLTVDAKINFQGKNIDFDRLVGVEIVGVVCHAVANVSKTPLTKAAVAADVTRNGGFLNIFNSDQNRTIERLPLSLLNPDKMNGKYYEIEPREYKVQDWELEFPDTAVITAGQALLFSIFYK